MQIQGLSFPVYSRRNPHIVLYRINSHLYTNFADEFLARDKEGFSNKEEAVFKENNVWCYGNLHELPALDEVVVFILFARRKFAPPQIMLFVCSPASLVKEGTNGTDKHRRLLFFTCTQHFTHKILAAKV